MYTTNIETRDPKKFGMQGFLLLCRSSAWLLVALIALNPLLTSCSDDDDDVDYPIFGDGVTDVDGNAYQTIIIGGQEWMAENLIVTSFPDGTDIPSGFTAEEWSQLETAAYAVHDHQDVDGIDLPQEMVSTYGMLYNWHAVSDEKGLCPEGWHIPSDADWQQLLDYLEQEHGIMNQDEAGGAGNALKAARQDGHPWGGDHNTAEHPYWLAHEKHHGTDDFAFNVVPAGGRGDDGLYKNLLEGAGFWTNTEASAGKAWHHYIIHLAGNVSRDDFDKRFGLSVRCIRKDD